MNSVPDTGRELNLQNGLSISSIKHDRWQGLIISAPLLAITFLSKFSTPTFASQGLGVGFPIALIILTFGILTGRVRLDTPRVAYFAVMVGFFGLVHILREEVFSTKSLVFLIAVTAVYVLEVPRSLVNREAPMIFFGNLSLVIAVIGIVQFISQFAIGRQFAFPIESFTPSGYFNAGYHSLNPLRYGSQIFKANGVFLLEASFFSQMLAIGIVIELTTRLRLLRLAVLALGMILSYSGTGLLILGVTLPAILIMQRRLDILAGLIAFLSMALIFSSPLGLDPILVRVTEFGDPRSSGYQRFIGWIFLARDTLGTNLWRGAFGYGAGLFRDVAAHSSYAPAEMLFSKLVEEYGVVGFTLYVGFLTFCIFRAPLPFAVRLAVLMLQFMNGAFSEMTIGITLSLALLNCSAPIATTQTVPGAKDRWPPSPLLGHS